MGIRLNRLGSISYSLRQVILALTFVHLVVFGAVAIGAVVKADGMMLSDGITPVGGDWVNLWTTARMVSEGRSAEIYDPEAFMAFQWSEVGSFTGFRLWAYPPHSVPATRIFHRVPYRGGWILWGLLGAAALWWGARRVGISPRGRLLLLLSPAALHCVFLGQSGNLMVGLLLAAVAARKGVDSPSVMSAAVLTVKPQLGVLIPVVWAVERRWARILLTVGTIMGLLALATLSMGIGAWQDYTHSTLPALAWFQQEGMGPFLYMIPSVFVAARFLVEDAALALTLHLWFAVPVLVVLLVRMSRSSHSRHLRALALLGTALVLPYLHSYDSPSSWPERSLHSRKTVTTCSSSASGSIPGWSEASSWPGPCPT